MYSNTSLQNYLETSSSVNLQSIVIAEWNMNFSDNIKTLGNYRYRPSIGSPTETNYGVPATTFDILDTLNAYTGATVSQIVNNTGLNSLTSNPTAFISKNQTEELLFSLKDCVSRFRPRSGINKLRFFKGKYINTPNENMFLQPRYYLASKDDKFKYWNSYRVEADKYTTTLTGFTATLATGTNVVSVASTSSFVVGQAPVKTSGTGAFGTNAIIISIDSATQMTLSVNHAVAGAITFSVNDFNPVERGIAKAFKATGEYYIEDAAPFVVYNNPVPANRIVVKMQTNASDFNNPAYKTSNNTNFNDPFYEDPTNTGALVNQETPETWTIQYLDSSNVWQTAKAFDASSTRSTGKRVIGSDGYVELAYGITNPSATFKRLLGEYASRYALPIDANVGDAYLIPGDTDSGVNPQGTIYVWNGSDWTTAKFNPIYGWYLNEEGLRENASNVTTLTSPEFYGTPTTVYDANYREFKYIKGIRLVVSTMSAQGAMFDLIEMSPRLVADLSDKTTSYSVTKVASDIGNSGIPVGQLLASTGSISIFDYDQSFNEYNDLTLSNGKITGSLVSDITSKNLQFKFYEQVIDDTDHTNVLSYFVPIKTFYVDGFPKISNADRMATLELRDLLFYFESQIAPSLLMRNVKLSKAIATMLDSIGFSNYKFYRNDNETDDVIPYFYIAPDTNVATVLNDLAQSTQTSMFFDEDNNLVTMSRNYIMPTATERKTDIKLYGTKDFAQSGIVSNMPTQSILSSIVSIDSEDNQVFNGGKITYSNKYIQKSYGTLKEASLLNNAQSYKYKPVLLWEVSGTEALRPTNDEVGNQSSYVLSALALNSELTDSLPIVDSNGVIQNNIMDFGQSIYWLTRYKGYLYANGEIIKYDGVEHTIQSSKLVGMQASITANTNTITLTSGNVYNVTVGQTITKTGGTGIFGSNPVVTAVDTSKNTITVSSLHSSTGTVTFDATTVAHNVWVKDVNDYQKYFAKLPFNGKLFPTGRVKIYAEPDYNLDGSVKQGAVAKHGRMQFGTGIYDIATGGLKPVKHTILDANNEWLDSTKAVAFKMESKWMFKDSHQYDQVIYTFTGCTGASGQKTVTLNSVSTTGSVQKGWIVTGSSVPSGTLVDTVATDGKSFTITKNLTGTAGTVTVTNRVLHNLTISGATPVLTEKPVVETTVKDMFNTATLTESSSSKSLDKSTPNGSIQASALIINGVKSKTGNSNDNVSYVYKDYSSITPSANTFGTRMRILGKQNATNDSTQAKQLPLGADAIDTITTSQNSYIVSGTGGGIAINLNNTSSNDNVGYYFELVALTSSTISDQGNTSESAQSIPNVYFYKVMYDSTNNSAVPYTLWFGSTPVLVDDGLFTGMGKIVGETNSTIYDLCVKTEELNKVGNKWQRRFFLYINNVLVGSVTDTDAIPLVDNKTKNMALFVRGGGRCIFEHVYSIEDTRKSQLEVSNSPMTKALGVKEQSFDGDAYRKYLVNPTVIDLFLSGISANGQNKHKVYYEEFGTIMRECAYFNIRYDKAYPALYSKISPTFNDRQGYLVSGFRSNPYGAEFLIFNITDFALSLDETSGNYLRIQGITFTQQSSHDLSVDEYFLKTSNLNDYANYSSLNNKFIDIQNSRNTYGKHDFSISGTYLQNEDMATKLMDWMVAKVMVPKKSVGMKVFANPMIQLGDIVTIDYVADNVQQLPNSRFVVYHIDYQRSGDGPEMTLYLSEVV
jgi:hypothetical protein